MTVKHPGDPVAMSRARAILGVSSRTLRRYRASGKLSDLRSPDGQQVFHLGDLEKSSSREWLGAPDTSTAKLHVDDRTSTFLFACAQAHQELVREIYRRHVVGHEHDWAKLEAGIRKRGSTRREARSAESLAEPAQEAT